jgi:FkbM family methyltransferase
MSKSQISQDVFVAGTLKLWNKKNKTRFFVEFGATDGVHLSNTYLFETYFQWNGILAEPGLSWHESLGKNRNCFIDHRCVYNKNDENILFNETVDGVYSTIDELSSNDLHLNRRKAGNRYHVKTVTLLQLLEDYSSPKIIDYLSVDTEGSEYLVLENFDFNKYRFKVITVEHNFTPRRKDLNELLKSNGYARVMTNVSQYDDWYIDMSANDK